MAANAVDFAGTLCGCRYEKELETYNILIYSFNEIHINDIFIMCMDFIKGFFNSCVVQSVVRHQ